MGSPSAKPEVFSPDQGMELVSRMVRSPLFIKSVRLQEFLVYGCKHALAG